AKVGGALSQAYPATFGLGGIANNFVSGMAGGVAGAATRSLLTGTDFGDNILADLPSVIGNTIGNAIAGKFDEFRVQRRIDAALGAPATKAQEQAASNAIADDPVNSLQWGGKPLGAAEAQQLIIDRIKLDEIYATSMGTDPVFLRKYLAFRSSLTAADAYNTTSNQAILGADLTRTSGDYVRGIISDNRGNGYQGYLYHDNVGDRNIFANAGTNDALDLRTDYELGGDTYVSQLDTAAQNARQLLLNEVPNLSFTGHSLGGPLAILQGLTIGRPVETFNSAPFSSALAKVYGVRLSAANRLVTNYRVANDPLSMAENNHALITAGALALEEIPVLGRRLPSDLPSRAWHLAPPPGRMISLPASSATGLAAHSIVNVANLLTAW
ncbi:MAG: hypothetical protein ABI743_13365, partial [bacterium]